MRKSNISQVIAGLILIVAFVSIAFSQPLSNEQIVISSVKVAVSNAVTGDSNYTLQVAVKAGEIERLVGDGIYDALVEKYRKPVYLTPLDSQMVTVNYDVQGIDFSYKKGASRGLLKGHKIARDFRCQLRINIQRGSSLESRDYHDIAVKFHDEIEPSDLNFVNSRRIPELAPAAPGSGWSRFAEPALVIASVGTLVYLFFANR